MKIAIAGTGYLGLSNTIWVAQHNHVVTLRVDGFFNSRIVTDLGEFNWE